MTNTEIIHGLREMATVIKEIREKVRRYNALCDSMGYVDDKLESPDVLQSRISQEIDWLDV